MFKATGSPSFGDGGSIGNSSNHNNQQKGCKQALRTAKQNEAAIKRAEAAWKTLVAAALANNISPDLLAAIGVRETGFRNIRQRPIGRGQGVGIFQLTVPWTSGPTAFADASNLVTSAYGAATMLGNNMTVLAQKYLFITFNPQQLLQATAASYNIGLGGISGNPKTIDNGTTGNNYGSNVVGLMQCFQ
jgi:hypothetical protein